MLGREELEKRGQFSSCPMIELDEISECSNWKDHIKMFEDTDFGIILPLDLLLGPKKQDLHVTILKEILNNRHAIGLSIDAAQLGFAVESSFGGVLRFFKVKPSAIQFIRINNLKSNSDLDGLKQTLIDNNYYSLTKIEIGFDEEIRKEFQSDEEEDADKHRLDNFNSFVENVDCLPSIAIKICILPPFPDFEDQRNWKTLARLNNKLNWIKLEYSGKLIYDEAEMIMKADKSTELQGNSFFNRNLTVQSLTELKVSASRCILF